jgi:hypothetical protein
MDLRWAGGNINRIRALAQELVALQPDIIVTAGPPATAAVQRETRTIPIVFAGVTDPVANGIVARLDRPSGNVFAKHFEKSAIIGFYANGAALRARATTSGGQARARPVIEVHPPRQLREGRRGLDARYSLP